MDSETPSDLPGKDVALQNLSKRSDNIVGIYEKASVSARTADNWRDRYLSSIDGINLSRTERRSYHVRQSRPQSAWLNDRQISASLSMKLQ
jgi:hypothetical protein